MTELVRVGFSTITGLVVCKVTSSRFEAYLERFLKLVKVVSKPQESELLASTSFTWKQTGHDQGQELEAVLIN